MIGTIFLLSALGIIGTEALSVQEAVQEKVVRRQNFGVLFRHQQPILSFTDTYVHHIIFELPSRNISEKFSIQEQGFIDRARTTDMNKNFSELIHTFSDVEPITFAMRQEIL